MAISKIILKKGLGHPGTILDIGEPAYDTSNNIMYIGRGIGLSPVPINSSTGTTITGVDKLSLLTDVELFALNDNQILVYDASILKWINTDFNFSYQLQDLTDVSALNPIHNQILMYNASTYIWESKLLDSIYGGYY